VPSRDYQSALAAARRELDALSRRRDELDTRIARLRQTVTTLAQLCNEAPQLDMGLTDACRSVVRGSVEALSATDIRDRVVSLGIDLGRYANGLGAVHTVLRRLLDAGDIRSTRGFGGKTVFFWNHRLPPFPVVVPSQPPGQRRSRRAPSTETRSR
jgi:hypothetical protein